MPDLLDRIYCSEQIHIPPTFPYIMKLYCKAAIRTQPYDLLKWSAAYFRALANGEEPPAKERVEYPPYDSPSGLTPGYIKILINQFGKDPSTTVSAQTLFKKWNDICLQEHLLIKLIALLGAATTVNWVKFVGVCAGFISKTLTQTMVLICELFTEEPEGGMATIPYDLFVDLYMFLAQMECGPLTDKEREEQDAIMIEEDICSVTEKIKQGVYEGEIEGEYLYEEEAGEETKTAEEEIEEKKTVEEEELSVKGKELEESSYVNEGEALEETEEILDQKEEVELEKEEKQEHELAVPSSEKSFFKEGKSLKSAESLEGEAHLSTPFEGETVCFQEQLKEVVMENAVEVEKPPEQAKSKPKKINLEDMEESIGVKIEEKLAAEEESLLGNEEEKEFENLSSYLLGAAFRVQNYTSEALGFRIFRKYLRQEVPGIGPYIETEQVEKVVNFMDYWSQKQEQMVMPRNIRHWMCPPLDKIPTPEP